MSTLSSSFIPDPLSSFASQRHRWLQRRRKHYMEATNKYSAQLCEILDSETKHKLQTLASNSLDISIPASLLPLRGITIQRSAIPFEVKLGQQVIIVDLAENKDIASGSIIAVNLAKVIIKLSKPIEPKPKPAEEADKQEPNDEEDSQSKQRTATSSELSEQSELPSEETIIDEEEEGTPATAKKHDEPGDVDDADGERIVVIGGDDEPDAEAVQKEATNEADGTLEWRIKFNWAEVLNRHECIANALNRFRKVSCSVPLHKCLLGYYNDQSDQIQEKARIMSFDQLPEPRDKMQRLAIEQTMRKRISLIEGPAGCGKTTLAAYIACNMSRLKKQKVLICSPVQKTVSKLGHLLAPIPNLLAIELPNKSLKVPASGSRCQTRTSGGARQPGGDSTSACHLDKLVDEEIYSMACRRSRDYFDGYSSKPGAGNCYSERVAIEEAKLRAINAHALRVVNSSSPWLRNKFEQKLLQRANIVCCNLLQTGSWQLEGIDFDLLIIDDVQWASEIECLVPIATRSIKQVTLLSDLRRDIRLPRRQQQSLSSFSHLVNSTNTNGNSKDNFYANNSTINHNQPRKAPLGKLNKLQRSYSTGNSFYANKQAAYGDDLPQQEFIGPTDELGGLFERWLSLGLSAVALRFQYRAHESLSTFTNNLFYCQPPRDDPKTNRKLTKEICRAFKRASDSFDWLPNKRCLTALIDERAFGETLDKTISTILRNLVEIEQIDKSKIGIIFNQLAYDLRGIDKSIIADIETGTVLDFIGDEKDFFLVVGCQRDQSSGNHSDIQEEQATTASKIDFLQFDNALNVALTRARLGLLIISDLNRQLPTLEDNTQTERNAGQAESANKTTLCKSWRDMIEYYVANELVKR